MYFKIVYGKLDNKGSLVYQATEYIESEDSEQVEAHLAQEDYLPVGVPIKKGWNYHQMRTGMGSKWARVEFITITSLI